MSQYGNAADDVLRLASRFQAIMDLAKMLKSIGSVETAAAEFEKKRADAKASHDGILVQIEAAKKDLAGVEAANANAAKAATAAAANTVMAAEARAEDIIDKANASALSIANAAKESAARIESDSNRRVQKLNADLATATTNLAQVTALLDAKKAEHDAVAEKVAALKKSAKSILE